MNEHRPGRYEIAIDRSRKLLSVRFSGFLTVADLDGYLDAKRIGLLRLGCAPNEHVTMCDFSECGPQSQDVLSVLAASLADPNTKSRRLAVLVSSKLAKLQAQRVLIRPGTACFERREDAFAWLIASLDGTPTIASANESTSGSVEAR